MLTENAIKAILASPGSYTYWCVVGNTADPFWSHTRIGHVLHVVTDSERAAQAERSRR